MRRQSHQVACAVEVPDQIVSEQGSPLECSAAHRNFPWLGVAAAVRQVQQGRYAYNLSEQLAGPPSHLGQVPLGSQSGLYRVMQRDILGVSVRAEVQDVRHLGTCEAEHTQDRRAECFTDLVRNG